MNSLLFDAKRDEQTHSDYGQLAAHEARFQIEQWHRQCTNSGLLDHDFATRFREQTPQCIAELFFANWLLTHKVSVVRPAGAGQHVAPDWLASAQGSTPTSFYVEVTCPTDGDQASPERVRMASTFTSDTSELATNAVDRDQIRCAVLRLSSSLHEKARLRHDDGRLLQAGRASSEGVPFVVALTTMGFSYPIDTSAIDGEFPVTDSGLLMRFLYGMNDPASVRMQQAGNESSGGTLTVSVLAHIKKSNRNEAQAIETRAFFPSCDPATRGHYSSISAVLFSGWSYQRVEWPPRPYMALLHNHNAKFPLPRGAFPDCYEYWLESKTASHFQIRQVARPRVA